MTDNTNKTASSPTLFINHNTCAAYQHAFDLDLFRTALLATSKIEGFQSICNLSRKVLGQTGDGHFCPIGGYNAEARKVLLLDTARFKYPPHWVDLELLYKAVCTTDGDTGLTRGFLLLARKPSHMERVSYPPILVRQPTLPSLDIATIFAQFCEER